MAATTTAATYAAPARISLASARRRGLRPTAVLADDLHRGAPG